MNAPIETAERFCQLVNPIFQRSRKIVMISEGKRVVCKRVPKKGDAPGAGASTWTVHEGSSASISHVTTTESGTITVHLRPIAMKDLVSIEQWQCGLDELTDMVEGIIPQLWTPIVKGFTKREDCLAILYFIRGFRDKFTEADYETLGLEAPIKMTANVVEKRVQAKRVWASW